MACFGATAHSKTVTHKLKPAAHFSTFGFANTQSNTKKPKELKFPHARIKYFK